MMYLNDRLAERKKKKSFNFNQPVLPSLPLSFSGEEEKKDKRKHRESETKYDNYQRRRTNYY